MKSQSFFNTEEEIKPQSEPSPKCRDKMKESIEMVFLWRQNLCSKMEHVLAHIIKRNGENTRKYISSVI